MGATGNAGSAKLAEALLAPITRFLPGMVYPAPVNYRCDLTVPFPRCFDLTSGREITRAEVNARYDAMARDPNRVQPIDAGPVGYVPPGWTFTVTVPQDDPDDPSGQWVRTEYRQEGAFTVAVQGERFPGRFRSGPFPWSSNVPSEPVMPPPPPPVQPANVPPDPVRPQTNGAPLGPPPANEPAAPLTEPAPATAGFPSLIVLLALGAVVWTFGRKGGA